MKLPLFFGLMLSLVACEEPPVMQLAHPSNETAIFDRQPVGWHILSGTNTTPTRKINISASARSGELCHQ